MAKAAEYTLKSLGCLLFFGIVWFWPHDCIRTIGLWIVDCKYRQEEPK